MKTKSISVTTLLTILLVPNITVSVSVCPGDENPVCSVRGITYLNMCYLRRMKDRVLHNGWCRHEHRHNKESRHGFIDLNDESDRRGEDIPLKKPFEASYDKEETLESEKTNENKSSYFYETQKNEDKETIRQLDVLLTYPDESNTKLEVKETKKEPSEPVNENKGLLGRIFDGILQTVYGSRPVSEPDDQKSNKEGRKLDVSDTQPQVHNNNPQETIINKIVTTTDKVAEKANLETSILADSSTRNNRWQHRHHYIPISVLIEQHGYKGANFKRLDVKTDNADSSIVINIPATHIVNFDNEPQTAKNENDRSEKNPKTVVHNDDNSHQHQKRGDTDQIRNQMHSHHSSGAINYNATEDQSNDQYNNFDARNNNNSKYDEQVHINKEPTHIMKSRALRIDEERSFD